MAKKINSKKSLWEIIGVLSFITAIFFAGIVIMIANPQFENSIKNQKKTEQNFVSALNYRAPFFASQFPKNITIFYKTAEGISATRDVVVHGYTVFPDESKCTEYYYPGNSTQGLNMRKACVSSVEETKSDFSWISKIKETLFFLQIWK